MAKQSSKSQRDKHKQFIRKHYPPAHAAVYESVIKSGQTNAQNLRAYLELLRQA